MQDFSTMSNEELFRLNCEVREAVENRLQKFDPKVFLKMCEQEILFAAQQKRDQVSVSLTGNDSVFLLSQFFKMSLTEGLNLWLKRFLTTTATFAPQAYVWYVWEETKDIITVVFHW